MSSHVLFNEETLESLVFERSKKWSSLIEHYAIINDDEEDVVDFDNVGELWKNEEIDDDGNDDTIVDPDEAIEDKSVDADIEMPKVTSSMPKTEITQILCSRGNPKENAEVQEILNQTLPVLEEHKRKWKEAGLDRILNTFDVQKIEHHVGQWLRRNNTVYMDKNSEAYSPPALSDNESLHSIDTARYIRQSRIRNPSSTTSVKCSATSTIKMYRTQPHKRDELRAKYAVHDDELEHRHHLEALRHRRRERERARARELSHCSSPRHCGGYKSNCHHQRRKHLLKRRSHSSLYYSSSSGDEDYPFRCNDCKTCRTTYQYCSSYPSHRDFRRHHLGSRSMHHLRRQHAFEEDTELDLRPRLHESECKCCNSERLCSNVVHLANSSTEEWIVENNSPVEVVTHKAVNSRTKQIKKLLSVSPSLVNKHEQHLKVSEEMHFFNRKKEDQTSVIRKPIKRKTPIETSTFKAPISKKGAIQLDQQPKLKVSQKLLPISEELVIAPETIPKTSKSEVYYIHDSDSSNEFVTESSEKQLSKKKCKQITALPTMDDINRGTSKITQSKAKRSIKKNTSTKDSSVKKSQNYRSPQRITAVDKKRSSKSVDSPDNSDSDDDLAQALILSEQCYKLEEKKRKGLLLDKGGMQQQSNTPFNNQSVVCNSTALPNNSACTRTLKKVVQQAAGTVSSTCNSNTSSASPADQAKEPNVDADCTIVTSTTGYEASKIKHSPIKITKKGILIHSANSEIDHFTLTESSLSKIIGQRRAQNFLKFYVGSRSFDGRHSVYYRPTPKLAALLSAGDSLSNNLNTSSSGSSDEDVFERIQRYGEVYSVLEKSHENNI